MKRNLLSRVIVVIMTVVMLATSCFSVASLSNSTSSAATNNNDDYFSLSFKDGILSVRLNSDKIYAILEDGSLTKEELLEFIPADILNALSKGRETSIDELRQLVANYITVDDFESLIDNVPTDILKKYFSLDMLLDIFTISEMVDLFPVEDIMSAIGTEELDKLLTDEAIELSLNDNLKNEVLTDEFIQNIIDNTSLVNDILAIPAIKQQLVGLVDSDVVNTLMADPIIGPRIITLASSDTVASRVLSNSTAVGILENYFTSTENDARFNLFIQDEAVDMALVSIDEIRTFLLTEEVIHSLVENGVITKTRFRQIFSKAEISSLITDDTIDTLMKDPDFVNRIFGDSELVGEIITPELALSMYQAGYISVSTPTPDTIKSAVLSNADARRMLAAHLRNNSDLDDYWEHIDFEDMAFSIESAIKDELARNSTAYNKLFDFENVVDPHEIIDAIGVENCKHLVHGHVADIIRKITISKVFEYYDQNSLVNVLGGYPSFVENNFITFDEVASAVGGYAKLLTFFDKDEIIGIVGVSRLAKYVHMSDLVDAAGGYIDLLKLYTEKELKKIFRAIGTDNILACAKEHAKDILLSIDYKDLAKDIVDLVKSDDPKFKEFVKAVSEQTLTILLTEVEGIYLNGETIYETGSFDLNKIIIETLRAIPDVNSFIELDKDDVFAKYIIEIDMAGKRYTYGIEFGFSKDPSNLQNLMKDYADRFRLDVSDNGDIELQATVPAIASNIYAKMLESDKIPNALKGKLITVPSLSVNEAKDLIAGLSEEEMTDIVNSLKDKTNDIKEKAYKEIEEKLDAYYQGSGLSGSEIQAKISNAKAKADEIINKFLSVNSVTKLKDKIASLMNKLPDNIKDAEILDFYNKKGNFSSSFGVSVDLYEVINRYISVPEDIKLLFKSTEVSYALSTDITISNMYELELMLADGSKFNTLLPAGVSLDVLGTVAGLGDISSGFCFEDTTTAMVMPEHDAKLYSNDLYSVQFAVNNNVIDTVFYVYGSSSITVPAVPSGFDRVGYTTAWKSFTLNSEKRLTVGLDYRPITYYATFMADGKEVAKIPFTINTTSITPPAVPAKTGYTGTWEGYRLGTSNITVNAIYRPITYYATFMADGREVAKVPFTVKMTSIVAPSVPTKTGYTGAWEAYRLEARNITVNAVYSLATYHVTFMADGKEVAKIPFTINTTSITPPAVPAKTGYTGAWSAYKLEAKNITVNAVYKPITYYATFMADGKEIARIPFTVETASITAPAVPDKSPWYTGAWEAYTLKAENITVNAVYAPITYYVTFMADGKQVGEPIPFTVDTHSITAPAVPAKVGYTGEWSHYELMPGNMVVHATYTPITYTATFMADGKEIGKVQFTLESTALTEPDIPEKLGYTGAWGSYTIEAKDITVNAVYTPIIYTATFVADGKEIAAIQFTIEDKSITEPAVPAKEGYTGKWESYTLGTADITINAIYTAISPIADDGGCWLWWILIIIAIIIIAIIIFFIIKSKKDDDTPPPPAVEPEPVIEPDTVVDPEPIVPVAPTVVTEEVEDVSAEEVDELMTDDDALASVIVVSEDKAPSSGPKSIINIGEINEHFADGDTVNLESLIAKDLVPAKTQVLKVLASGHLNKHHLTFEANSFSVQAIKMIRLTGGTVIQKK